MKVLQLTNNYPSKEYPIFGIFVKEQVESLSKIGVECEVFYAESNGGGFKKYITYLPKLWWKLLTTRYDVIHCHHVISGILLCLTGMPLFKKCVLSYQGDPLWEWGDKTFKLIYLFFNKIIIKNKSEYLKYKKTIYLPNGTNSDFFRPIDMIECRNKLGWSMDNIYILFMDSNKKARTVKRLDIFEKVLDILKEKFQYKNVEPVILRNTPREKIPIYMNACNLHLLCSDFEGSPNSVKECVCCNTPVVSTDVGNVRDMIGDIEGCYVAKTSDPEELAEYVNNVLQSSEPFNGREKFLAKGYDIRTVAEKLKYIYNGL